MLNYLLKAVFLEAPKNITNLETNIDDIDTNVTLLQQTRAAFVSKCEELILNLQARALEIAGAGDFYYNIKTKCTSCEWEQYEIIQTETCPECESATERVENFGTTTSLSSSILDWAVALIEDEEVTVLYSHVMGPFDENEDIILFENTYDYIIDYIYHPVGLTGTYGIDGSINNLQVAKTLLTANKTKNEKTVEYLQNFI